jgi:membrane protease YdiL (CAAX protease family)
MSFPQPPFSQIKARYLVLSTLLLGLAGTIAVVALNLTVLPQIDRDPLLVPVLYALIMGGLCGVGLWLGDRNRLSWPRLMGSWLTARGWRLQLLVIPTLLFSLGSFQVSFVALSWVMPDFVEQALQQDLFADTTDSTASWLYESLLTINVVLVAPITEEFIFRGLLLHRWGYKWSSTTAILASSILFGLLHTNVVGLTIFGIMMALLYCTTGSLWVPIVAHALNNLVVLLLSTVTSTESPDPASSLAEFQANWWMGLILMLVSAPVLIPFIWRHWPRGNELPYVTNRSRP